MSTIGYYICVPFAWLVRLFYNLTNSYGVALILFTLVIKLIMLPFQSIGGYPLGFELGISNETFLEV